MCSICSRIYYGDKAVCPEGDRVPAIFECECAIDPIFTALKVVTVVASEEKGVESNQRSKKSKKKVEQDQGASSKEAISVTYKNITDNEEAFTCSAAKVCCGYNTY